ncbi:MAG: EscU/YscU/HrcU family type III secretion system export apparatus switch protein [Armatimonadetes bacterium]|nr:EscU/YscU/HrcU family type III secretion system export apparatus switch protein [Armatimonadota bacterium]
MQSLRSWLLGGEMESDEHKPYPPTARRLQRLRELGAGPHSPAVRAAAISLLAVLGAIAFSAFSVHEFCKMFSRACTAASEVGPDEVRAYILSFSVRPVILAVLVVALMLAVAAWVSDAAIAGGGCGRLGHWGTRPGQRVWLALRGTVAATLSAGAAVAWALSIIHRVPGTSVASIGSLAGVAALVGAGAAILLALADIALAWLQFIHTASMSRRQLLEELREARGPALWQVIRTRRFRRRRRR